MSRLRRRWLLALLVGVGAVSAALLPSSPDDAIHAPVASAAIVEPPAPLDLPRRQTLGRARGDLFAPTSSARPPQLPAEVDEPPQPSAPPLPYRIAGTIAYDGALRLVLAAGDRIYEAKVGEMLDGHYRVEAVAADSVTLLYTPLGIEQHLTYAADADGQSRLAHQPSANTPPALANVQNPPAPATNQEARPPSPFPPGSPLARR